MVGRPRSRSTASSQNLVNIPLEDVPEDGTPLTVTASVQRTLGSMDDEEPLSERDFEDGMWIIKRQTEEGWTYIDKCHGRPYAPHLKDNYNAGKYQITPLSPQGKPLSKFTSVVNVGKATAREDAEEAHHHHYPEQDQEEDAMPAWMRWQMQQSSDEKVESQRRAADAEARRQEWEQESRRRDYEKEERREREEKARMDREREDRQSRVEQQNMMMQHAVTLLGSFFAAKHQTDNSADVNEKMLTAILAMQQSRSTENTGLRDSIEMLALLDSLRPAPLAAPEKDDDDDSLIKTLGSVAPMIAMMRGGGGGGGGGGVDPVMIETAVKTAFHDPATVAKIAMEDPKGVAQSVVAAVRSNPGLEKALVDAFEAEKD